MFGVLKWLLKALSLVILIAEDVFRCPQVNSVRFDFIVIIIEHSKLSFLNVMTRTSKVVIVTDIQQV
jgi:hypothetical protein